MWFVVHLCDIGGTSCDMHLCLQNGRTPLMEASGGGHVECVKLLLDRGAQANHQSKVSAVLISVVSCLNAYMYTMYMYVYMYVTNH